MKKYEFKNYLTHRSAEIHVDVGGWPGFVFVMHYYKGEPDCDLRGCSEPGSGCKRFTSEAAAIRSARCYVTKEVSK